MSLPVVLHIPHASKLIPPECREDFLLTPAELERELLLLTDAHTELAAAAVPEARAVIAPVSRLVVDMERFRDDELESMAGAGMGAVYARTHDGKPLRRLTPAKRETLLRRYYDPHHARLAEAAAEMLAEYGRCLILDVHSFASRPLPHEPDQAPGRPEICLGTDAYHTPRRLAEAAAAFFTEKGFKVMENSPFAGSMVPSAYYRREPRVSSLMLEINRRLIMDEGTGKILEGATRVFEMVGGLAEAVLALSAQE